MESVLVAYATKYGSTGEVAEAIAERLRSLGLEATARPAREVKDLSGYSAVVLGTALYFFRWRGEAHRFLRRNRKDLASMPVAVFGLGPIEDKPEQFTGARAHLDKGLAKHGWLRPVAATIFGGRLEPSTLRFPDNNPAMRAMGAFDLRDFEAIDAWADSLPDAFGVSGRHS
jgi:menaquinone-dependent protoporphyrinogen oxidase